MSRMQAVKRYNLGLRTHVYSFMVRTALSPGTPINLGHLIEIYVSSREGRGKKTCGPVDTKKQNFVGGQE